jgi:hypothetical protein
MNLALRLVLYTAVTFGMFGGLASGVWWLVTPDPSLQRPSEAKASPIPPRIAESIERKVPVPVQQPAPIGAAPPAPPMQEAPVSLVMPKLVEPKRSYRAVKVTRGTKSREEKPSVQSYVVPAVTSHRTDFPF